MLSHDSAIILFLGQCSFDSAVQVIVSKVCNIGDLAEKYKLGYIMEKENYNSRGEASIKIMSNAKIRGSFYDKHNYDKLSSILLPNSGAKAIYEINQRIKSIYFY